MSDFTVHKGDCRDWVITLSDASGDALDLTGATVEFQLKWHERYTQAYFIRNTGGTGSDYISIGSPASDAEVTITPTASDWADISDSYGIYVGSFKVTDANSVVQYTKDIEINIQEEI